MMDTLEFLLALKNMRTVAKICHKIKFAQLAAALKKTNPHLAKQGMNKEDAELLSELAEHFAKTNEIVERIANKSALRRKLMENARNN